MYVRYKVHDESQIGHLETKKFLAHSETKNELVNYLAEKLTCKAFTRHRNWLCYSLREYTCLTNLGDLQEDIKLCYNHEEADTGIVLHAIEVCKRNPFSDVTISCSDADVLFILLNYQGDICTSSTFKTNTKEFKLQNVSELLGKELCQALLGFRSHRLRPKHGSSVAFRKKRNVGMHWNLVAQNSYRLSNSNK